MTLATAQYLQTTCVYRMLVYELPGGLVLFRDLLLLAVAQRYVTCKETRKE